MPILRRLLLASPLLAAGTLTAGAAHAQLELSRPLPNVLLLIDTSGSMENMADGRTPEDAGATCVPGTPTPMNRWATLVSTLTGSINNFSCYAQPRDSTAFIDEYSLPGPLLSPPVPPYDQGYYLPYHRILSGTCTAGAGTQNLLGIPLLPPPLDIFWSAPSYHPYNNPSGTCTMSQLEDGLLDVYKERVRFSMMTFDTLPDGHTGSLLGVLPDNTGGMNGNWSYFNGWQLLNEGGEYGQLPACAAVRHEVGARNSAAPSWEGGLVNFNKGDAPLSHIVQANDRIQQTLLATRPYGATPLAGMLRDAQTYLQEDLLGNVVNDIFSIGGCRKTYIIILSDGEPNLDMRPECTAPTGDCPYELPEIIAHELAAHPTRPVETFAVGFGVTSGPGFDCKTLTEGQITGSYCATATGSLKACCTLSRIAYEGGTDHAYFAANGSELSDALSDVLSKLSVGTDSRTYPVFTSATATGTGAQGNAPAASYEFATSFYASPGDLWQGNLERKRYVCEGVPAEPVLKDIEPSRGDNFVANLNSGTPARRFLTVVPNSLTDPSDSTAVDAYREDVKETIHSRFSIRPKLVSDDGWGLYSGVATNGANGGPPTSAGSIISSMQGNPTAMNMVPVPPACTATNLAGPSATASSCAEQVMRWQLGEPTGGGKPTRDGAEFGAIFHSTPAVVGTPSAFLRDEAYAAFALTQSERPTVLYTGTTDGQLHAFKVASNKANETASFGKVDTQNNNELWAFMPPYVLPGILSQYDHTQQYLLDGAPVIKDVVFSRTTGQAQSGSGSWRTVLVAGGGRGGGYYYALDITNPEEPVFLWQLATTTYGRPLFGKTSGTPAIATVALQNGTSVEEVAVAILPGGYAGEPVSACPAALNINRRTSDFTHISSSYQPRNKVRCWMRSAARSLTIARIDTGEVLMHLRGHQNDGPTDNGLVDGTDYKSGYFDSPITGVPVAYPSGAGQVANRVYVGDADGTLWRIDLSAKDPTLWSARIAWDAYSVTGDSASNGQPIHTPPIVAVDGVGNQIILFSTGDQELFTSSAAVQARVWSISEKPNGFTSFRLDANWFLPFVNGKRVTGPISLFNSVAYFATFTPTGAANSCDHGSGSIWGVDYLASTPSGGGPRPVGRYVPDPENFPNDVEDEVVQDPGVMVFGVAVTQTPTCQETTTFNDPYGNSYQAVTSASSAEFQLVFQTGQGGSAQNKSVTNSKTQTLPRPRETTRFDSWAAIVE
jgi:type IV pilus assembly protein PilY1